MATETNHIPNQLKPGRFRSNFEVSERERYIDVTKSVPTSNDNISLNQGPRNRVIVALWAKYRMVLRRLLKSQEGMCVVVHVELMLR